MKQLYVIYTIMLIFHSSECWVTTSRRSSLWDPFVLVKLVRFGTKGAKMKKQTTHFELQIKVIFSDLIIYMTRITGASDG